MTDPRQRLCEEALVASGDRQVVQMIQEAPDLGLEESLLKMVRHFEGKAQVKGWAREAMESCKKDGKVSQAHSAALFCYLRDAVLAKKVNQMAVGKLQAPDSEFAPFLRLLTASVSGLDPYLGTVFRVVTDPQHHGLRMYSQSAAAKEDVRWHAPALCNTELPSIGEAMRNVTCSRLIFIIDNAMGADVSEYSQVRPAVGRDILVLGCPMFSVRSVWSLSDSIHFVRLEMSRDTSDEQWANPWAASAPVDDHQYLLSRLRAAEDEVAAKTSQIHSLQARLAGQPMYPISPASLSPTTCPPTGPTAPSPPQCLPEPEPEPEKKTGCGCKRAATAEHQCVSFCEGMGCDESCGRPGGKVVKKVIKPSKKAVNIQRLPSPAPALRVEEPVVPPVREAPQVKSKCGCKRALKSDHMCVSFCKSVLGCDGVSCGLPGDAKGKKPNGKKSKEKKGTSPPLPTSQASVKTPVEVPPPVAVVPVVPIVPVEAAPQIPTPAQAQPYMPPESHHPYEPSLPIQLVTQQPPPPQLLHPHLEPVSVVPELQEGGGYSPTYSQKLQEELEYVQAWL